MALKSSEKQLIGIMLIVAGGAVFFMWGLPALDGLSQAWSKRGELEANLKAVGTQEQTLKTSLATLQEQMQLPNDVQVRTYTQERLQAEVKDILDKVLRNAADSNNTIVHLTPWPEVPAILPPPEPLKDENGQTAQSDPNNPPPPPPPPPLTTIGYELAIRGSYGSIQSFLKAMDQEREMVDISSMQLLNEQGPDRAGAQGGVTGQDVLVDPFKPIRLTAKLRLILEPR